MRDFFDPLGRNAAAAQHVREKRPDISGPLRAAERDQQHGVEGREDNPAIILTGNLIDAPSASGLAARVGELLHRHGERDGLSAAAAVPDAGARRRRDVARRHRGRRRGGQQRPQDRVGPAGGSHRRARSRWCSPATACRRRAAAHRARRRWPQVLAMRFADRLGKGIRGAPRDAMLATFATESNRGRVFGFHRAHGSRRRGHRPADRVGLPLLLSRTTTARSSR